MPALYVFRVVNALDHIRSSITSSWKSSTKISPAIQAILSVTLISVLSSGTSWAAECPVFASPLVSHFKFDSQVGGTTADEVGAQNISVQKHQQHNWRRQQRSAS